MVTLTATLAIMGVIARALPEQILDDGKQVRFGQKIEDVSALLGKPAVDNPSSIARKGIDKQILLQGVTLSFDSGLLWDMEFEDDYQFKHPPCPFAESWKNFDPIDGKSIKSQMTRAEFVAYLALWEARAKAMGKTKVDFGDVAADQYRLSFNKDKFSDTIHIVLGPTRSTGRGGLWSDSWHARFYTEDRTKPPGRPVGTLKSLSANEDDFNTNSRRR